MGKIKTGILGGFSGKVGNVVGSSWNGVDYIRTLAKSMKNPKTQKQLSQRMKFTMILNFVNEVIEFIQIGFRNAGKGQTPYSEAMSYNLQNAITGEYPNFEIDYSKIVLSKGNLYAPNEVSVTAENGSLRFSWSTRVRPKSSPDDVVMLLAYNVDRLEAEYDVKAGIRETGSATLDLPSEWDGEQVEAYLVFTSTENKKVSKTRYAGSHIVVFD